MSRELPRLARTALAIAVLVAMVAAVWRGVPPRIARVWNGGWGRAVARATDEDGASMGLRRAVGGDAAALAFALEHVPEDGFVVLRFEADAERPRRNQGWIAAQNLLFPRQALPMSKFREGIVEGRYALSEGVYVLDRRPAEPLDLETPGEGAAGSWERVGGKQLWALWRWRGEDG